MGSQSMHALIKSPIGQLESIGGGRHSGELAFIPSPLPRSVSLSEEIVYALDAARGAVGTLVGVGETLPNPRLLIDPLMRREAVSSSRIEGTMASLSDLFLYEATSSHGNQLGFGDVVEVYNYLRALGEGLRLMQEKNLPLSMRLMNEMHKVLMQHKVRGHERPQGEFRSDQVWIGPEGTPIGEARFVPPPASMVRDLIYDLEEFANDRTSLIPPLVRCAMLHYQFEAIHPYWDGNGRIGRLLITMFLHAQGVLSAPLLHLSAYFERDRSHYYGGLYHLSQTGDWDQWLKYFLRGVQVQAEDTLTLARSIRDLHDEYVAVLQKAKGSTGNDFKLLEEVFRRPYMTFPRAASLLGITNPGARLVVQRLVKAGVLQEVPGMWPRVFRAEAILELLGAGQPS